MTPIDASTTRLPKDHTEGDIPRMAIVTGAADPLECLLLKIGISPDEIKEPGNGARIDFYQGDHNPGTTIDDQTTPQGNTLYSSSAQLAKYDVVMLPCEGSLYDQSSGTANIVKYLDAGGRVFTTHWSYSWWQYDNSPFIPRVGQWEPRALGDKYDDANGIMGILNTNFPKGKDFADWLTAAAVDSSPHGQLNIIQGRHNIHQAGQDAQDWINYDFGTMLGGAGLMHMTFNTPLDAPIDPDTKQPQYCGRAVYSDFHVTAKALNHTPPDNGPTGTFPDDCVTDKLTDQEKALAFMLFDLSSCVQSDDEPHIS